LDIWHKLGWKSQAGSEGQAVGKQRAARSRVQQSKQKVDTVEVAGRKKGSRGKLVEGRRKGQGEENSSRAAAREAGGQSKEGQTVGAEG
jgi:hypothetical protein